MYFRLFWAFWENCLHTGMREFSPALCAKIQSLLCLCRGASGFALLSVIGWVNLSNSGDCYQVQLAMRLSYTSLAFICNKAYILISIFLTLLPFFLCLSVGSELEEEKGCCLLSFPAIQQLVVAFFTGRALVSSLALIISLV